MSVDAILRHPLLYDAFQHLAGGYRARRYYVDRHIRPRPGMRVLDIGCGTGEMRRFFPERTTYVGTDPSPDYVDAARERFGDRATFLCSSGEHPPVPHWGEFDLVHATGVLHHLDDDGALELVESSRTAMAEGGRFFTLDGCLMDSNNRLETMVLERDRGKFMRTEAEYVALAQESYGTVSSRTYRRLFFPLPYPCVVMECAP